MKSIAVVFGCAVLAILAGVVVYVGSPCYTAHLSSIRILSDGLMGDACLAAGPGGGIDNLTSGDEFRFAQGSVNLRALVGKAIYHSGSSE